MVINVKDGRQYVQYECDKERLETYVSQETRRITGDTMIGGTMIRNLQESSFLKSLKIRNIEIGLIIYSTPFIENDESDFWIN